MGLDIVAGIVWMGMLVWAIYEGIKSPAYDDEGNIITEHFKVEVERKVGKQRTLNELRQVKTHGYKPPSPSRNNNIKKK